MGDIINLLNDIIWSNALIALCLGAGVYFSIRLGFPQVRMLKHMIQLLFKKNSSDTGISSFQAFALAISGRVGTGNIAGVATAIALGGPGAIFWMWVIAFLGSSSAIVEATLGQIYKVKQDGEFRGGPAYYIFHGLKIKWFAFVFAGATIVAMAFFLPGVQSNSIGSSMNEAFGIEPYVSGIFVALMLSLVIFGGVKRIANVAQVVVPVMALAYILVAMIIIGMNISEVPKVFSLIINSAFGAEELFGGIIGQAIIWGVKRGIYSNEAGQGTAPHAAAAAQVEHPVQQGLVQGFSVYIDTLFVCTATALMILFTGSYNVRDESVSSSEPTMIVENLPGVSYGPEFTQMAVESEFASYGKPFVAIALLFFAFTTIIAYYYIAETNVGFIGGTKQRRKILIFTLRFVIIASTIYGAMSSAGYAWSLGDIGVGLMAWLNIIAMFMLQKPALRAFKDYKRQLKSKEQISFSPKEIGIENADYWESKK